MARIRSPGYPSFSLEQAVEYARKVHEADRQHPVPRDVAARHMGFTGLTGTSDRALSALMHFGLAEKVGKGEIRVTELALRIIHADTLDEMRAALHEAAFKPDLFKELRDRYPGAPPSAGSLSSYLSRENFAPAAIGPAAKAYLETCHYLQRERAYESDGDATEDKAESPPPKEIETMLASPLPNSTSAPAPAVRGVVSSPSAVRSDVFTIGDDGEVVVTLPTTMTQQTYDDLKDWLDLIGRKAQRKIAAERPRADNSDA